MLAALAIKKDPILIESQLSSKILLFLDHMIPHTTNDWLLFLESPYPMYFLYNCKSCRSRSGLSESISERTGSYISEFRFLLYEWLHNFEMLKQNFITVLNLLHFRYQSFWIYIYLSSVKKDFTPFCISQHFSRL